MACLDNLAKGKKMIDPDEHEQAALEFASQMGGEFVESLGKTDLAAFSAEDWATLVECIVTGYQDKLMEATSDNARD